MVTHNFLLEICATPTRADALRPAQSVPHFVLPAGLEPTTTDPKSVMISISLREHFLPYPTLKLDFFP